MSQNIITLTDGTTAIQTTVFENHKTAKQWKVEATEHGLTVQQLKAQAILQDGGLPLIKAHVTGKGKAAAVHAETARQFDALVSVKGHVNVKALWATVAQEAAVCGVPATPILKPIIGRDGQPTMIEVWPLEMVADWATSFERVSTETGKTGKATTRAKAADKACKVIQAVLSLQEARKEQHGLAVPLAALAAPKPVKVEALTS